MPYRDFGLVFWREITERLRSRTFQATTLFIAVASFGVTAVAAPVVRATTTHRLGVIGTLPAGLPQAAAQLQSERPRTRIELRGVPDEAAGRAEVEAGSLDAFALDASRVVVLHDRDTADAVLLVRALRRAEVAQRLTSTGVTDEEAQRLVGIVIPDVTVLRPFNTSGAVAGFGALAAAFFLLLYGVSITQAVIQETTSGVSNIMVAMCPPRRFVVGKTLGIGLMGVVQALAASVPATVLLLSRTAKPPFSVWTLAGALMWFALAYALYGHLFTALAAKGRRIEKVAGTTVWVTIPLAIFSFGGVLLAFGAPNAPVTAVASFLPVTAPFAMPVRSAAATLGWWEVPVAALATALGAVAVARWSAWLYVRGLARQ